MGRRWPLRGTLHRRAQAASFYPAHWAGSVGEDVFVVGHGIHVVARFFFIRHALRAGFTIEEIFNLTKIDRWFLVQIKEIVDFEEELATAKN